jgi:hypothetical protein
MTLKITLMTLVVFAVAQVITREVAYFVFVGFTPFSPISAALFSVALFSLVWIVAAAVAFLVSLGRSGVFPGLIMASLIWTTFPVLLEVSNLRGDGFSITLGRDPVIEDGQLTDLGWRLLYAKLVTSVSSLIPSILYAYLALRRSRHGNLD